MAVRSGDDAEVGPYHRAILAAFESLGIPRVHDLNDVDADIGAAPFAANIRDGIRWNAAFAYLDPCATGRTSRSSATRSSIASSCGPVRRRACTRSATAAPS